MAGPNTKKRNHQDLASRPKQQRPKKKQKKVPAYHSDSDEEESTNADFRPVNLLDSDDEDLDNVAVDDAPSGSDSDADSNSDLDDDEARISSKSTAKQRKTPSVKFAQDAPSDKNPDEELNSDDGDEDGSDDDEGSGSDASTSSHPRKSKSKRNDPDAFATSMSKILSTKLSTTRRADPVLSRSADAHRAAKDVVDSALEAKARKHLREAKRAAQEKGRVRDVLLGAVDAGTGLPATSTEAVRSAERRLKKTAHRGVVLLFRAVREAQEKAAEADREARRDGFVGVQRRQDKVNEMSRQGFLDLIAGGGGALTKGALEEA
ncbi:Rrp15p-domain-containing protein [Hypoxylon fuscum]|nr:Rrp15p-domain-containing protein [Hypoxylon fuscum]